MQSIIYSVAVGRAWAPRLVAGAVSLLMILPMAVAVAVAVWVGQDQSARELVAELGAGVGKPV